MFRSCLSEKHVYHGCQSTDEQPEASEGESSRIGNSRLNLNSHKCQIDVSNVTKCILKRTLIIYGKTPNKTIMISSQRNSKSTKLVDKRKRPRHVQHIGQCDARSSNNKWQAEIPARRLCGWVTEGW